jgi:trypsin
LSISVASEVPFDGNVARISGWGAPYSGAWLSAQLTWQEVIIVYFNDCKYNYEGIGDTITERMVCAESRSGGPCQGDSGNPLVYNEQLIGLMSWSFGCGERKYPAVYTDVTKFRGWIADYTGLSF